MNVTSDSLTTANADHTVIRTRRKNRYVRRVLWGLVIVLGLLVGYKIVRGGIYGWSAYQSGMALMQMGEDALTPEELPQIQVELLKLSRALGGLEYELRLFAPFLRQLDLIPTYGGLIAAAPELLVAGRELTAVGGEALAIIVPPLLESGVAGLPETLPQALTAAQNSFAAMAERAALAHDALARVPVATLPPALAGPFAQIEPLLPTMAPGLRMVPVLPDLLGMTEPRIYLVLVQNNHELRGTGGFVTALGQVTLDGGKIANLDFMDSYDVRRDDVEYGWAPEPMRRYMGIELLFLRDANWSPDLPTSAQTIKALYAQDQGVEVDGVMTLDLHAVELLVEALGSLTVPGTDAPITSATIVDQIKQFWDTPLTEAENPAAGTATDWWHSRKDFMPILAQATLERIQSGKLDYAHAIQSTLRALDQRAIQVWVAHDQAAEQLAALGWDGGLDVRAGMDFLALVDTNLGYNKVDSVLERTIEYEVTWPDGPGEPAQARATISYHHPLDVADHQCDITPRYGSSYDDMAARCYFDYVRLYVPAGSELIRIDGVVPDSATSQRGEANSQILAGYFVMKPASQHQIVFHYRLPASLTPHKYRLMVRRQSGVGDLPFTATIAAQKIATTLDSGVLIWPPILDYPIRLPD